MTLLNRYGPSHFSQVNRQLSGVYYVGSQIAKVSPWYILNGKLRRLSKAFKRAAGRPAVAVSTGDCGTLDLLENSIDYVFTDPPFGENIYYADFNYLVESWHRVRTAVAPEAIIDQAKGKTLTDYLHAMQRCFAEYRRVLKPGRWMTAVFHNSRSAVWNAIQEAILAAGFVVADVRTLDKRQGSYRQVTSTAVKQDLVISAYKPNYGLEARFELAAGTEEGVWDYLGQSYLKGFADRQQKDATWQFRKLTNEIRLRGITRLHRFHTTTRPRISPGTVITRLSAGSRLSSHGGHRCLRRSAATSSRYPSGTSRCGSPTKIEPGFSNTCSFTYCVSQDTWNG